MKNLKLAALSICVIFCCLCSLAQKIQNRSVSINEPDYNKPKLFGDLPDRISFSPDRMVVLLNTPVGQTINIPVTQAFNISGQVVSKADDSNSSTVVVRLSNRPGARLIFTKLTDPKNSIKYIGRIISLKHGDGYEIVLENDQYCLKKKGVYEMVSE